MIPLDEGAGWGSKGGYKLPFDPPLTPGRCFDSLRRKAIPKLAGTRAAIGELIRSPTVVARCTKLKSRREMT
jgi:hypothetical protein